MDTKHNLSPTGGDVGTYVLSLGCDKNKVDGEVMRGQLMAEGFISVDTPGVAVVIIINTCGFIREAVQESIDLILEMAAYKKGLCKALVVVGCMTERYRGEMSKEMPEIDAVLGVADRDKIIDVLKGILKNNSSYTIVTPPEKNNLHYRLLARKNVPFPHIAYVKIAEGCDNHCSYCTIPTIRGGYKSRPLAEIIEECRALVDDGVKELVLVAQDTALYGIDLYGEPRLAELLKELDVCIKESGQVVWVRLLYAYPEHITPELIQTIAVLPCVCKYIDMPIQHSEDTTLTRMGRKGSRKRLGDLIQRLREHIPGITLRTTLMVGFPGETNEEFRGLYTFTKETLFDRLGVFPFSREEGTPAATMPKQVKDEIKQQRRNRIMALQQKIHIKKQREKIGGLLSVMVDEKTEGRYVGRTQADAFEVDAVVYFTSPAELLPGQVVTVLATHISDYDLQGVHTHESAE
jgi:ribosomal protein S12 methylthiotransferase